GGLSATVDRTTGPDAPSAQPGQAAKEILEMQRLSREVLIAGHGKEFALKVMLATHPESEYAPEKTNRFVRYGSSPRGAQAMILAAKIRALVQGRFNVAFEDVQQVAYPALRHRLILNFEGEAEGVSPDEIVTDILARISETASPKVTV